jgi:hypothetical protein
VRLRPPARAATRLAAVLAGGLLLGTTVVTGSAAAAPVVRTVSDAQLAACSPTSNPALPCEQTIRGAGSAAVVDTAGGSHLRLSTPGGSDKATVASFELAGRPLSAISTLEYRTLVETPGSGNAQQAPALNIAINPRKSGQTFTTLVWEPLYTGVPVEVGEWQTWRPSDTSAPRGGWWASGAFAGDGAPNGFGFNSFQAGLAEVKAALPDAEIMWVGVNQGSGNPALVAGVDGLRVNDTTYDFENPVAPTAIAKASGDGQSADPKAAFAQPLAVRLTGRGTAAVPAPGASVEFRVTAGDAAFPGGATATATTGADGVATSPALTAGLAPGPVTVTATSGALSTTFTLTVRTPAGPPVADLALTATGVPATAEPADTITATITVRNLSSFPATQVRTAVAAPSGLRITATPGGLRLGPTAAFVVPSLGPGKSVTHTVTFVVDPGARGPRVVTVGTASPVRDPDLRNNAALPRVVIR